MSSNCSFRTRYLPGRCNRLRSWAAIQLVQLCIDDLVCVVTWWFLRFTYLAIKIQVDELLIWLLEALCDFIKDLLELPRHSMHEVFGINWVVFHCYVLVPRIVYQLQHFILRRRKAIDIVKEIFVQWRRLLEHNLHLLEEKSDVWRPAVVNIEEIQNLLLQVIHINLLRYLENLLLIDRVVRLGGRLRQVIFGLVLPALKVRKERVLICLPVLLDLGVHLIANARKELADHLFVQVLVHLAFINIDVKQLNFIFVRRCSFFLRAEGELNGSTNVFVERANAR